MLNLRIETLISYILSKDIKEREKLEDHTRKNFESREEILYEVLPIDNDIRGFYEYGKKFYKPKEEKIEEIKEEKEDYSNDNIIEYIRTKIREKNNE